MRIITPYKFFADRSSEWLSQDPPKWYKNMRPDYERNGPHSTSTRWCPSFVELWKNSLVLKSPVDLEFFYNCDTGTLHSDCAEIRNFIMSTEHDLKSGIDEWYGERYLSFKLHIEMLVVSDKVESMMFLPPEYHERSERESLINPQLGILESIPNGGCQFVCNLRLDRTALEEDSYFYLKKGTPIAYLYFPNGAPKKLEYVPTDEYESLVWQRTEFKAEYLRTLTQSKRDQESKCPFNEKKS